MKTKKTKTGVRKNGQVFEKMDVLRHFFEEPEREFHTRELARLAGFAPSTISKYLAEMVKSSVIVARESKGFMLFRSNTQSMLYKDAKLFYNIQQIRKSKLVEFLVEQFNQPKAIILFGSFRKSENVPGSDIDIFIETAAKKDADLRKFEKKLGHSIQIIQFSSKEVEQMKTRNKEMLNNIINGFLLEGYFEVFR